MEESLQRYILEQIICRQRVPLPYVYLEATEFQVVAVLGKEVVCYAKRR